MTGSREPLFYDAAEEKKRIEKFARDLCRPDQPSSEDRARVAYDTFRNGFQGGVLPPEWDKAPSWIRDAMLVVYLQGKLDGRNA